MAFLSCMCPLLTASRRVIWCCRVIM
ncbi:hypothetical protein QTP70_017188 [Hemibagrus guttatus]|uniref:Uncharacterized protein n=1 Tax=Hemibagrus guttatus TaxID=175788 RepID=A0AAE0PVL7_9TELE|nr:hypothetical protein QTP70_017188 [Hemibagrus guttatus]